MFSLASRSQTQLRPRRIQPTTCSCSCAVFSTHKSRHFLMSQWNVAPRAEKPRRNGKTHAPFDSSCRCDMCLNRCALIDETQESSLTHAQKDGVRAKAPMPSSSSAAAWHRAGWETRPRRHCMRQPIPPPVEIQPGPTREKEAELALDALIAGGPGRQYNGPVLLKPAECTYLHSRKMQHSHRTVFLSSSAPKRDSNYGALLGELDIRLENLHKTLALVKQLQVGRVDCQVGSEEEQDTISMRHCVNQSLAKQMDFFTGAMASWAMQGRCCGCSGRVDLESGQACCSSCSHLASLAALRAKANHHQMVLKQMGVGTA